MRSIADVLSHLFAHQRHHSGSGGQFEHALISGDDRQTNAQASAQTQGPSAPTQAPSRQEVLHYLGSLAHEYHLPERLVYAVADAESSINPRVDPQPNYLTRHGKRVHDKQGNPIVKSWDYGLMQINSPRIGHDFVRDANGHRFKIEENVIHDWKANARAGVAIIKHAHDVITLSEGPGASSEDIALGTYSYYNHDHSWHKFLERDKHGVPKDGAVRNFYNKYRISPNR